VKGPDGRIPELTTAVILSVSYFNEVSFLTPYFYTLPEISFRRGCEGLNQVP
jgi:hypothetical protein